MEIRTSEKIDPVVDELMDEDTGQQNTNELSQETIDAFKSFAETFSNEFDGPDEESIVDEENTVSQDETNSSNNPFSDIEIKWGPEIDLAVDQTPDQDSTAADPSSIDEVNPSEDHSADPNGNADATGADVDSSEEETLKSGAGAFGNASSASEFLNSKMSMNDLVREMASRAFTNVPNSASPGSEQGSTSTQGLNQPHSAQNGGSFVGQVAEPYPRMGLGSASLLLGTKGLQGLASMIGAGGKAVGTAISDFSFGNSEKDLALAITSIRSGLAEMKLGGLSVLEEDMLSDTDKKEVLKQYLAKSENQAIFDKLVNKIDSLSELSSKVMRKGLDRGMDGDSVMNKAIDPVNRLMKDNESFLKNLYTGDKTLHERLEGAVTALFEMLRDVLAQIQVLFNGQSQEQKQSGPRLG